MKKTKKWMVSLVILPLLLVACGKKDDANSKEIKIGANFELSGGTAAYGKAEMDGVKLAVKEINEKGGIDGKKIKLVEKDNKSDPAESASATTNLAAKEKVVAMLGPATSGNVKAATPNATKSKMALITPSATDDSVTATGDKVNEFVYRVCFQDSFQGITLANFAEKELKAKKAVIVSDKSSDYAKGLVTSFKKQFKGKIVDQVSFTQGESDFKAILTKLKGKDFDVLYLPGYYAEAGLVIKQAREMGIDQPILGADGFGDEKLVKLAGAKNVTKVYYTAHFATQTKDKKVTEFVKSFKNEYKKEPNAFNALAYDSVYMLKAAIEKADSIDRAKIVAEIAKLKDFKGVTGTIAMDKEHNPVKSIVVVGLEEGKETSSVVVEP